MGRPDFWLVFPTHPLTRGGLVSPSGDRSWKVSLSGVAPDRAPRTAAEFLDYAESLERPWIADLLRQGEPDSRPSTFGRPSAVWRRYDKLNPPVVGLLPVGDAVATLNPLQGQGISAAAWQVDLLADLLAGCDDLEEITRRHNEGVAEVVRSAWDVMTIFDSRSTGPRLGDADWSALREAVRSNATDHRSYVEVWHLLAPVRSLVDIAGRPKEELVHR